MILPFIFYISAAAKSLQSCPTLCDPVCLYFNVKCTYPSYIYGFPGGSAVKNLPAMQETWVHSLGWEDPLEKGTATYSSILA